MKKQLVQQNHYGMEVAGMNYEAMILETDNMIREIMRREQMWEAVLIGLAALLTVLAAVMMVQVHRDHKARKMAEWGQYRPTVTDEVQVAHGVEFHRMGAAGKR